VASSHSHQLFYLINQHWLTHQLQYILQLARSHQFLLTTGLSYYACYLHRLSATSCSIILTTRNKSPAIILTKAYAPSYQLFNFLNQHCLIHQIQYLAVFYYWSQLTVTSYYACCLHWLTATSYSTILTTGTRKQVTSYYTYYGICSHGHQLC
jgi:hypothetical protein